MSSIEVIALSEVGAAGSYPDWVKALRGKSGAYVITDLDGAVLYVGESGTSRLYQTMTRHFQRWTDKYDTAGPTFDRKNCLLSVAITQPQMSRIVQDALICALSPMYNRFECGDIISGDKYENLQDLYLQMLEAAGYSVDDIVQAMEIPLEEVPF
jgi:hypothetical protein